MIDLDTLNAGNPEFELYCQVGCWLLTNRITYEEWRTIVFKFGLHLYVVPNSRVIVERLLDAGWAMNKKSPAALIQCGLRVRDMESHYTEAHQVRMAEILENKSPENSLAAML